MKFNMSGAMPVESARLGVSCVSASGWETVLLGL